MALNQNTTPLSLFKPLGLTPLQALDRLRDLFPEYKDSKLSYAGRLDPLASGVMLVLVDDNNYERDKYLNLSKVYQAQILLGVSTDTGDLLGLVKNISKADVEVEEKYLTEILKKFVGKFTQEYPQFSSPKIAGKQNFSRPVEIKDISLKKIESLKRGDLLNYIKINIDRVRGDFRQEAILTKWIKAEADLPEKMVLLSIEVSTGSGVYIRSLAERIGASLNMPALAYSIKRVSVGDYTIDRALKLE